MERYHVRAWTVNFCKSHELKYIADAKKAESSNIEPLTETAAREHTEKNLKKVQGKF
jgi:hypothetical protein